MRPNTPICAPATPLLPSAIALVRVSGPGLRETLAPLVLLPKPRVASLRTLQWDGFRERALVLFFPSPNSYTGEDVVELQVHGNPLLVRRLLAERLGVRAIARVTGRSRSWVQGFVNTLYRENTPHDPGPPPKSRPRS